MSWTPPIRCTGRTYPNAPVQARFGSINRGPPYFFFTASTGINADWPPRNEAMPMRYQGYLIIAPFITRNDWLFTFIHPPGALEVSLFTTWNLTLGFTRTLKLQKLVGPNPFTITYRDAYPLGISAWNAVDNLPLLADGGGYPGGAPAFWPLNRGDYGRMPANNCILP